jgi:methyl-accepting chemotaxis protein
MQMNVSSSQSATVQAYGQLQRQAAQRNAEQLEAQARALAAQARSARKTADEAERTAADLEIQSGSARTAADSAKQAVTASAGVREFGKRMSMQAEKIAEAMQAGDNTKNLYERSGRSTGSSYAAGSLFNFSS